MNSEELDHNLDYRPPTLDKFVPEEPPVEEAKEESKAEEGKKEFKENPRKFAPQVF